MEGSSRKRWRRRVCGVGGCIIRGSQGKRETGGAFRGYVCRCFDKLMGIDNAHAIGCVSPKPAGGAGSGPEILNDSPPTAGTRAFSRTLASTRTHCCTYLACDGTLVFTSIGLYFTSIGNDLASGKFRFWRRTPQFRRLNFARIFTREFSVGKFEELFVCRFRLVGNSEIFSTPVLNSLIPRLETS